MSAYWGGLALIKCWEHERSVEISANARLVLAIMAAHHKDTDHTDPPQYFGSQATIAIRSGLSPRSVRNALDELQDLKLIERDGKGRDGTRGKTVRWGLTLLSAARADKSNPPNRPKGTSDDDGLSAPDADKSNPAPRADKNPAPRADNPSESYRGLPREDDDSRSGTARSADAALAPEPSEPPALINPATSAIDTCVEMTVAGLGYAAKRAQGWVEQTLARASRPVDDPVAYIRTAIETERKRVAAKPAAPATAVKPSAKPATVERATAKTTASRSSEPCRDCGRVGCDCLQRTLAMPTGRCDCGRYVGMPQRPSDVVVCEECKSRAGAA